ncbi:hypothetical protein ES705_09710 [subsurface metagenome]
MEKNKNICDLLSEYLDVGTEGINILEEQIDSVTQSEYFECSNKSNNQRSQEEIIRDKDLIFDKTIPIDHKKNILVQLASINSVEAYRAIEKYLYESNNNLYGWTYLALQESRLLLESKFLDENKVLITTGLGGKGNKLRYFIVFFTGDWSSISLVQQRIIKSELDFAFSRSGAEIEDIIFEDSFASILTIIPIHVPVQQLFDKVIKECNEFGSFLFNDYIITNVRVLSIEEIRELLAINNIL